MSQNMPPVRELPYATIAPEFWDHFSLKDVADWTQEARQGTVELATDLSDEQLLGPRLPTVNPLLWELGHVAWFQEKWVLRSAGQPPLNVGVDALYDSMAVPHDTRWDLPLFSREKVLRYLEDVHAKVQERLQGRPTDREIFLHLLALFHEDMHAEAFLINRQTLGYPAPNWRAEQPAVPAGPYPGDVDVPGGEYLLGAKPEEPFVFDNEKWAHPVDVRPFRMARAPVTQEEFAAFVDDGGYGREAWWSPDGWKWRQQCGARHPVYWRRESAGWQRRQFDSWVRLEPHRPVINVCWYEAQAFCRWAGRRLPTEAEWEAAAAGLGPKRRFPWGDTWPEPGQANLNGSALSCVDVAAFPSGDNPAGCRQLIGNVWEWTASAFEPYPGFVADPYREYSEPWFHTRKVLRGGCWATQARLIRNTWRNFYEPDRRDVWAGFRTCPLDA